MAMQINNTNCARREQIMLRASHHLHDPRMMVCSCKKCACAGNKICRIFQKSWFIRKEKNTYIFLFSGKKYPDRNPTVHKECAVSNSFLNLIKNEPQTVASRFCFVSRFMFCYWGLQLG